MLDRKLGYAILCIIFIIISVSITFVIISLFSPGETRIIAFDRIGNLRLEDPIKIKGSPAGTVKKIILKKDSVLVVVNSKKHLAIHKGYSIANMDEGIMGDRILQVDCGDTTAPLINVGDTLTGTFYPGVSEVLGYAWMLHDIVDTLVTISGVLLHGTSSKKSLIAQTESVIFTVDSLSRIALKVTRKINAVTSSRLDSIEAIVKHTSRVARIFTAAAPEYIDNINDRLRTVSGLLTAIDTTADNLRQLTINMQKPDGVLFGDDVENIRKKLVELQNILATIQKRLLQFKIYLRLH